MPSSCRSLEVERGGLVGEMVHLDPGSEPSHKLELGLGFGVFVETLGLGSGIGLDLYICIVFVGSDESCMYCYLRVS